jgi:hypothetical protein
MFDNITTLCFSCVKPQMELLARSLGKVDAYSLFASPRMTRKRSSIHACTQERDMNKKKRFDNFLSSKNWSWDSAPEMRTTEKSSMSSSSMQIRRAAVCPVLGPSPAASMGGSICLDRRQRGGGSSTYAVFIHAGRYRPS